jgi:DNA-binding NarL/FixJ family response regulator
MGEAGTAADLMRLLGQYRRCVLLLDIKLPDASGLTLVRDIKSRFPHVRIVILTMYDQVHYASHALSGGATGFVVKGASFDELLRAVRMADRGQSYVCADIASELVGRFKSDWHAVRLEALSKREIETLGLLASGLTLKEVGTQMGISGKTVGTYRRRIMEKLHFATTAELIRYAMDTGILP